jgi:glycosyltransferase involved in cell wall biosynthesis
MKISILTPDLSGNCLGRAWLLTKLLQRHYEVELIGPLFGKCIWKPLAEECDFDTKIVKGYANGLFEINKMLRMITGDIIYASKPLMTSFGVAVLKKLLTKRKLLLDIDDLELGFGKEFFDSLVWYKKLNDFRISITHLNSYYYTLVLNRFVHFADAITVSGNVLYSKYGGTTVWHGRDTKDFDPEKYNTIELKNKFFPSMNSDVFIVGFIGTPRPHKGLENLIDAMGLIRDQRFVLMVVGIEEDTYFAELKKRVEDLRLKDTTFFFPQQPFKTLPDFLSVADLVVVPQSKRAASYGQVPAKIFDAMAMAKPIIATNIADIPEILRDCGWIVEPDDHRRLADTILYVSNHQDEAKEKGKKARDKCKREYSWNAMEKRLISIIGKISSNDRK